MLGEKIQKARKNRGWRLVDLGNAVGLSIAQISDIENGKLKKLPDHDVIVRIADVLDDDSIPFRLPR